LTTLKSLSKEESLRAYYSTLLSAWGRQHWWPARTRFEVVVGAYLTQATAWTNVELALRRLRANGLLNLEAIRNTPLLELEMLIRSSGYFRQKARRLKTFVAFVDAGYGGSLRRMFAQPTGKLRQELLELNGVGPETADSILLYGGQHPVFVVDAYTRRILDRHGILPMNTPYEQIRELFESALTTSDDERRDLSISGQGGAVHRPSPMSLAQRSLVAQLYNDMHALLVGVGKNHCVRSEPRCDSCPLRQFLPRTDRGHGQRSPRPSL
jgi:endonuclease-3 related protein